MNRFISKKQIICILVGLLLLIIIPINISSIQNKPLVNDEPDQEQTVANIYYQMYDDVHLAQRFSPTFDNLTRIRLRLNKTGEISSNILVSIRDERINNTKNIAQSTINASKITEEKSWVEVNFTNALLDLSKQHFIICQTSEGDVNNSYNWWASNFDNYLNGYPIFSIDAGYGWIPNYTADFSFQTYGKMIPRETKIEILYLTGGPGAQINYGIENTGETVIGTHYYFLNLTGTLVFPKTGIDGQGTVNLAPGERVDRFIFPIFGIGPAEIRLEVWTDNSDSSIIEKNAFILLSYIYIRPTL